MKKKKNFKRKLKKGFQCESIVLLAQYMTNNYKIVYISIIHDKRLTVLNQKCTDMKMDPATGFLNKSK